MLLNYNIMSETFTVYDKLVPPELVRTVASYGDGEPRIVIDNIVLRNFKSFHGEKVVGPFNSVT